MPISHEELLREEAAMARDQGSVDPERDEMDREEAAEVVYPVAPPSKAD